MRKIWNIASIALIAVLSAAVALTMLCVGALSLVLDRENGFLGYSALTVEMDSADVKTGDLVFAGATALQSGDKVVCRSNDPQSYGRIMVCTVDNTAEETVRMTDGREVPSVLILGTARSVIPGGADFLQKCKSPLCFWLWAILPLVVVFTLVTLRSVDKYRREK